MGTTTNTGHNHSGSGSGSCPACTRSQTPVKVRVPERCIVRFRPSSSWKGEYGFDWMREGDTKLVGDTDYNKIVGTYGKVYATETGAVFTRDQSKYTQLKGNCYKPFPVSWKKDTKGHTYDYMVPWIALFPQAECKGNEKKYQAKLTLDIEVVSREPDAIKFVYDSQFIHLDKTEITQKSVGKHQMDLTITCLKEFDKDQEIKVVPYKSVAEGLKHELAGKLMVLKNNKANRYKANIVFVKVQAKINAAASTGSTVNEAAYLQRYFFQSLTTLKSAELNLDLKNNAVFNSNYVIPKDALHKAVNTFLPGNVMVHEFLEQEFDKQHPGYGGWFKIFFFNESGGYLKKGIYQGLNGCARKIPSLSVVLYNGHNTATTTHELLHAVGLYHTFDNSGSYTYKIGETENIMDYSHSNLYSNPVKDRINTWKWQWDILHSKLQKE